MLITMYYNYFVNHSKEGDEMSKENFIPELQDIITSKYPDIIIDSNVAHIESGLTLYNNIIGGIPIGKMVVIQALEGTGKSSLMVQLASSIQQNKYPILYLDTEASMSTDRFNQLGFNLKNENTMYLQPSTLQEIFHIIQDSIKLKMSKYGNLPFFIIWDSIASTPADEEVKMTDITGQEIGIRARILSQGLRVITNLLSKTNTSLLTINQYRMKMQTMGGWGGPQYTTPGGLAPRFHAFQTIELKDSKKYPDFIEIGKLVKVKALKNKMLPPLVEFMMYYTYDHGFDNIWSMFFFLHNNKKIKASGAWMKLDGYDDVKFHQKEFKDIYNENEEFRNKVNETVNELCGVVKPNIVNKNEDIEEGDKE